MSITGVTRLHARKLYIAALKEDFAAKGRRMEEITKVTDPSQSEVHIQFWYLSLRGVCLGSGSGSKKTLSMQGHPVEGEVGFVGRLWKVLDRLAVMKTVLEIVKLDHLNIFLHCIHWTRICATYYPSLERP